MLVYIVVATFLHCVKKVSRTVANTVLVAGAMAFGKAAIDQLKPAASTYSLPKFPRDIRTAIKELHIDPVLHQTISCPNCFTQYSLDTRMSHCEQRATSRSELCGAALRLPTGKPQKLYSTQSLITWLEVFRERSVTISSVHHGTQ